MQTIHNYTPHLSLKKVKLHWKDLSLHRGNSELDGS